MRDKLMEISSAVAVLALVLTTIGQNIESDGLPHTTAGWLKLSGAVLASLAALWAKDPYKK